MRLAVEVIRHIPCPITTTFVKEVVRDTLISTRLVFLLEKTISVNIVFVASQEIQQLNKAYRRKNTVTDVLSFPEYTHRKEMLDDAGEHIFLGDMIVCYDYIVQSASEDRVSLNQEMAYIISHGTLHLLGFRHSKKMFALQDVVSEVYAR